MNDIHVTQPVPPIAVTHAVGAIAIVVGILSAIGVVLFIAMYILFASSNEALGHQVGMLNDIGVALQYLLTIPVALALYPILQRYHPALMRIATITGVASMLLVTILQLLLIFKVLTFEQQLPWIALVIIVGVGSWLVLTGLAAQSTGKLPNNLLFSALAVPYFGYPVWAFWLGLRLLNW